jgi:hypothetical protein
MRYFKIKLDGEVDHHRWWPTSLVSRSWQALHARTQYLATPATSVASERMFSTSGNVITDKPG